MTYAGAVELMNLGFKLFPLRVWFNENTGKNVKQPFPGTNGFKDAVSSPDEAPEWFKDKTWWGCVHDDMTIVDADGEHGVQSLNDALHVLPKSSVVIQTAGGGVHWIIAGGTDLPGRKIRKFAPGLDILTGNDSGFFVTWPSPGYTILSGSFERLREDINNELAGPDQISGDAIPF